MFINLLGGKCKYCGSVNDLHFDHKDPKDKEFYIGRNMSRAEEILLKEIQKCQLLCGNCHRIKTKENGDFAHPPARHGTIWMYKHPEIKCRCKDCRMAMSKYYYDKLSK